MDKCPCGSGHLYSKCCGRFIDNGELPQTPEQLMRSRYVAYTLANIDYIKNTMRGKALEGFEPIEAKVWAQACDWKNLKVVSAPAVPAMAQQGFVEYIASYKLNGKFHKLHENSHFEQIDGKWFYIDGGGER